MCQTHLELYFFVVRSLNSGTAVKNLPGLEMLQTHLEPFFLVVLGSLDGVEHSITKIVIRKVEKESKKNLPGLET